jgi:hypothetical protein
LYPRTESLHGHLVRLAQLGQRSEQATHRALERTWADPLRGGTDGVDGGVDIEVECGAAAAARL